ncbi:hypothetical protein C2G38_2116869 [Gigaspora rosea]|uniref:Uncharacterized protein n=1 Tax=Gigaspora rosea TaxID=44941 RepID=A0A397U7D0_9GLOM|nr:hypothetical protein C2G38_2116869 [Gigaspora rosea]
MIVLHINDVLTYNVSTYIRMYVHLMILKSEFINDLHKCFYVYLYTYNFFLFAFKFIHDFILG